MALITLALDTTTRPGSAAVVRDDDVLDVVVGDDARSHGERLPGELIRLIARHQLTLRDVDLYAVAAGPGSFTGLRIGIACIQGLALAHDRRVVPVSALDALAIAGAHRSDEPVAVWMDAQRGQVFSRVFLGAGHVQTLLPLVDARVDTPTDTLRSWQRDGDMLRRVRAFVGDGAVRYAGVIRHALGTDVAVVDPSPLAGVIGTMARIGAADAVHPAAIQPIYVRRPDAELARDHRGEAGTRARGRT